jgi:hypothetical protein
MATPSRANLIAAYRRDRDLARVAPRLGEVRGRLGRLAGLAAALAAELDATDPWTRAAVASGGCLACPELAEAVAGDLAWQLDAVAAAADRIVDRLPDWRDRRASSAANLSGPPPRWRAVAALAAMMPGASAAELHDAALMLFTEAGDDDPEIGLADIVRSIRRERWGRTPRSETEFVPMPAE